MEVPGKILNRGPIKLGKTFTVEPIPLWTVKLLCRSNSIAINNGMGSTVFAVGDQPNTCFTLCVPYGTQGIKTFIAC